MQLESSSDLAVQSKVQFHPLKDQVKNLEEQIQCLKFDNEQLRLHVNDFITTSVSHIGQVLEATPVKTHGDMDLLISEELKTENDVHVIAEPTILTSTDSKITYQFPLAEVTLHEVNLIAINIIVGITFMNCNFNSQSHSG